MECIKTKGDNSVRYLEEKSGNYININYIIYISEVSSIWMMIEAKTQGREAEHTCSEERVPEIEFHIESVHNFGS